jgi:hypothetical protein
MVALVAERRALCFRPRRREATMSLSDDVRIRAVLLRVADETEAGGLSDGETRALIEAALPGIAWPAIEAMAARMAAQLAEEFNFHDELQLLCEPVWLEFPRLTVREAIALLASRGDLRAIEILAANHLGVEPPE